MTSKAKTADQGSGDALTGRSAVLRTEPVSPSRPTVGVAIASKFAEQHQVDPDEAYREAVFAEIGAKLQQIVKAFCIAVAVFAVAYFGGRELLAVVS